ncbi:MAG: hypothetical protein IKX57_03750 [Oscillospiraceae bacterium]|nr:hypothetical protein [Oscillospiraceae bacterium]
MNEIFIVLIRAHTGLGSIARLFTRYPYTHAALSLDRSLTDFVSYSRRYHSFPFDAGFTHEYRDYYAFGKHKDVKIKVFRLCPDDAHMQEIRRFLAQCESDRSQIFNLYAMMTMPLLHGLPVWKAHNCMSFSAKIAALSGIVRLTKPCERCALPELDAMLSPYLYFEGMLPRQSSAGYKRYMRPFSPVKFLTDMLRLNGQLISRMLLKRNRKRSDNW